MYIKIRQDGSYEEIKIPIIRANSKYQEIVRVAAPFSLKDIVEVSYSVKGTNESVSHFLWGKQENGENVWENYISHKALSLIGKYRAGLILMSFSIKQIQIPKKAINYVGKTELKPSEDGVDGDYFLTSKGYVWYFLNGEWHFSNYMKIITTSSIEVPVDPNIEVDSEFIDVDEEEFALLAGRVAVNEVAISELEERAEYLEFESERLENAKVNRDGDTMSGDLDLGNNKLKGVGAIETDKSFIDINKGLNMAIGALKTPRGFEFYANDNLMFSAIGGADGQQKGLYVHSNDLKGLRTTIPTTPDGAISKNVLENFAFKKGDDLDLDGKKIILNDDIKIFSDGVNIIVADGENTLFLVNEEIISANNKPIVFVTDPVNPKDAANKVYVDTKAVPQTRTIAGISLQNNISKVALTAALDEATEDKKGLLNSTDKKLLDTVRELLKNDDDEDFVNTIQEILDVFENYPEGLDIFEEFAKKVDKTTTINGKVIGETLTSSDIPFDDTDVKAELERLESEKVAKDENADLMLNVDKIKLDKILETGNEDKFLNAKLEYKKIQAEQVEMNSLNAFSGMTVEQAMEYVKQLAGVIVVDLGGFEDYDFNAPLDFGFFTGTTEEINAYNILEREMIIDYEEGVAYIGLGNGEKEPLI